MDPVTILVSIIVIIFLAKVYNNQKQQTSKNLPPGPRPLPLIGSIHLIDLKKPYKSFIELSKQYGPVYTLHLGMSKMVILCGYDAVKEALVNNADDFADRPRTPLFYKLQKDHGIVFSNGENWKAMRRFTLSTLRDYGMGKKGIEDKINEEAECLVQTFISYGGKPFDNRTILNAAVANIIVSMLLNHRFEYDDPTLLRLMNSVSENIRLRGQPMARLYDMFPTLIDPLPGVHNKIAEYSEKMHDFMRETFTKQRKDLDVDHQRNLIDAFLAKQKEGKPESTLYYHDDNLTALMTQLFGAGMETTSTTLRWSLLIMIKYPEIQKKVQKEIEKVIGTAQPKIEHRKQMPYTDAVVCEVQRFGDIAPTNLPHATARDITFRGYFIPKGFTIFPLLSSVLKDKAYFAKPDEFYPEHFLDADGNFKKNDAFIPFSADIAENMFSMDPVTILVSIIAILFLATVYNNQKQQKGKNLPPGPRPYPLIGSIHLIDLKQPHKSFIELSVQYGPVYTIYLGMSKMVILCGYDAVKEALINHADEFADRPRTPLMHKLQKNNGIVFSNGENWKAMRRFTLSTLRDYGMGKKGIEDKINEEAECLVQTFRSYGGKPFDIQTILSAAVANIIVSVLLNCRFEYDDPTLLSLMNCVTESMRLMGTPMARLYNMFPTLIELLPGAHNTIIAYIKQLHNFMRETLTKRRKDLDVNNKRSLIDAFLAKQQEGKPESTLYYHDDNLTILLAQLFGGGMETTSITLRWSILIMIKYPEIQKKVQNEIEKVIGMAQPKMEHRKQMPYTDAVVCEVQRFGNISAATPPHATACDITFRGYFLPKGTTVLPLLFSVLKDEAYFSKPDEFYPEHFLDADGNFKKNDAFIPFSAGKRSCAGESLAKMELFLLFTILLQNFTFQAPPGTVVDLTPAVGSTNSPLPQEICAIPRN